MKPGAHGRTRHPLHAAFATCQKELHGYLVRRLKSAQEAEDLAQEVYLRLLRVENTELVRSPQDYLYGIAAHVVYQFKIRTHRDVVTYDSEVLAETAEHPCELEPDELADQLSLQRELKQALAQLPPTHQVVFLLRKRDGFSIPEIAQQLALSTHTVKKYLFQARAQLRTCWGARGSEGHD